MVNRQDVMLLKGQTIKNVVQDQSGYVVLVLSNGSRVFIASEWFFDQYGNYFDTSTIMTTIDRYKAAFKLA